MKFRKSILVSTAQASIGDTQALMDALRAGKLAYGSLDVFDREPLPPEDPILSLPNGVLSPHNSGMTPRSHREGKPDGGG